MTGAGRGGGRIREGEKLGPSRHHCSLLATPRLDAPAAGLVVLFSMEWLAFQQHLITVLLQLLFDQKKVVSVSKPSTNLKHNQL